MRKFLCSLLFLACSLSAHAAIPQAVLTKVHKATYYIGQGTIAGIGTCSATAIGPQALMTATHCEQPTDMLLFRGLNTPATIVGRIRDGNDHTIYLLKNIHFSDYVDVDLNDSQVQGEEVFIFGNPGTWRDILREGYIAGISQRGARLFSFEADHGDSGSGVFNNTGKLIDIISQSVDSTPDEDDDAGVTMSASFPMAFVQAEIDQARVFSFPDDPIVEPKAPDTGKK